MREETTEEFAERKRLALRNALESWRHRVLTRIISYQTHEPIGEHDDGLPQRCPVCRLPNNNMSKHLNEAHDAFLEEAF